MASDSDVLNIAEIPHEDGSLRFRYSRYLSPDAKKWIRNGLFHAFHPNGQLAAAQPPKATTRPARSMALWRYWDEQGQPEEDEEYVDGQLVPR